MAMPMGGALNSIDEPMKVSISLDSLGQAQHQAAQHACACLCGLPAHVQLNSSDPEFRVAQALRQSQLSLSVCGVFGDTSYAFRPPPGLNLPTPRALGESEEPWKLHGAASTCSTTDGSIQEFDDTEDEFVVPTARRMGIATRSHVWAKTTVLMQNIPNRHSRTLLQAIIDEAGFRGSYNFLYLPADFRTKVSFGYAFLNFMCQDDAERFMQHFRGFSSWGSNSMKVCSVSWSGAQGGLEALVQKYRNCSVMHGIVPDEFKPVLFHNSERITFPEPTTRVRKPRLPGQHA